MIEDRRGIDKLRFVLKGTAFELTRDRMVGLYADTKFRIIYVSNPKSGCTTIKNVLFYCDRKFSFMSRNESIHHTMHFGDLAVTIILMT